MEIADTRSEMATGLQGHESTDGKADQVDRSSAGVPGNRLGQGVKVRLAGQRPVEGEPVEAEKIQAVLLSKPPKQRTLTGRAGSTMEIDDDPALFRAELSIGQG